MSNPAIRRFGNSAIGDAFAYQLWGWVVFLTLVCTILCSCRATRLTKRTKSTVDSVQSAVKQNDSLQHKQFVSQTERQKDSLVNVAAVSLRQSFKPTDLLPAINTAGFKVPVVFSSKKEHVHSSVTVDTAGNITVDCKADSLQFVVKSLIERNTVLRDSLAHTRQTLYSSRTSHTATDTSVYTRARTWLGRNWWWLVLCGLAVIAFELRLRIFHNKLKNPFS